MTVREMIKALTDFNGDLPVEVEGYEVGTENGNLGYEPTAVEGWIAEDGRAGVTVFARRRLRGVIH